MSWSPEHIPQTGEALLSDLDGVAHGDHHGVGLKLWRALARAGLWNTQTNRHGMNGSEAEAAFAAESSETDGFRRLDDLGKKYIFDFVRTGLPPIYIDTNAYRRVLFDTIEEVASYAHTELLEEITDIVRRSGRPGVFITNSPLTPATMLVHRLLPGVPTVVFSPFDVRAENDRMALRVATPEVRINKGGFALLIMDDYEIDPNRTIGYGDTESDIPLFDVLASPIAVNPTDGLRAHAVKWEIPIRDIAA